MGREVVPLTAQHLEEAARVLGQAFIGSLISKALLHRADQEQVACYLETANPRNVPPYERLGFQTVCEKEIMGARVWFMWRDPQHLTISRRDRPSAQRAG